MPRVARLLSAAQIMERCELEAWLRLTMTDGVGNGTARRLLAAFGAPEAIFAQPEAALSQVVKPGLAASICRCPAGLSERRLRVLLHRAGPAQCPAATDRFRTWSAGLCGATARLR